MRLKNALILKKLKEDEYSSWTHLMNNLISLNKTCVGNTFLQSILISYAGQIKSIDRNALIDMTKKMLDSVSIEYKSDYNLFNHTYGVNEKDVLITECMPVDQ